MINNNFDQNLIKLLTDNAGQSSYKLSKILMVSPSTIRRRKRILIKSGVIRETLSVDYQKLGMGLVAHLALNVEHERLNFIWQELSQIPQIKRKSILAGRYDILAMVRLKSAEDLLNFVQEHITKIKGIKNCETFISLKQEEHS